MAEAALLVGVPCTRRAPEHALIAGDLRPKEFTKNAYDLSDSEDDSNVGKMPPSDSEDE